MIRYDFQTQIAFSRSTVQETCDDVIRAMLPGVVAITKSHLSDDLNGIDYWVTLRKGAMVGIDHKARAAGCSQYWKGDPELALEIWSSIPLPGCDGKTGWTLDESKNTDYTLHTFDPSDTTECFLLPFQLLRVAFRKNFRLWVSGYRTGIQNSGRWQSQCVFVPSLVVIDAIRDVMVAAA